METKQRNSRNFSRNTTEENSFAETSGEKIKNLTNSRWLRLRVFSICQNWQCSNLKDKFYPRRSNFFKIARTILGLIIFKILQQHPFNMTRSIYGLAWSGRPVSTNGRRPKVANYGRTIQNSKSTLVFSTNANTGYLVLKLANGRRRTWDGGEIIITWLFFNRLFLPETWFLICPFKFRLERINKSSKI